MFKTTFIAAAATLMLTFGVAPGTTSIAEAKTTTQVNNEQRAKVAKAKTASKQAARSAANKAKRK